MHNIPCGNRRKALINLQNQGHDLRGKLVEDIGTRDISFVSKKTKSRERYKKVGVLRSMPPVFLGRVSLGKHLVSDYVAIGPWRNEWIRHSFPNKPL